MIQGKYLSLQRITPNKNGDFMKPKLLRAIAVIVGISLFAGCAPWHSYSHKVEPVDLSRIKSFYVVHNPDDSADLDKVIKDTFISLGLEVAMGSIDKVPQDVDALVAYEFQWFWDITNYLLMMKILIRDADTQWPLAMGESVRPSLARRSPEEMALEILEPLFKPGKAN